MEHGVKAVELPSSSSQPFAARHSQSHNFHQGGTSSLLSASGTTATLPARFFSSPEATFHRSEALSHSATVSVRSQPRTVPFAPSEPAPSTRMQRQKHLMDLLGSIWSWVSRVVDLRSYLSIAIKFTGIGPTNHGQSCHQWASACPRLMHHTGTLRASLLINQFNSAQFLICPNWIVLRM